MRALNRDSEGLGAELTIIGNGTPEEAAVFHETLLEGEVRLLTDPTLTSYQAMELKRSLYASLKPRTFFAGFRLVRLGQKGAKRQGDALQQGGAFVISPDHEVPYAFFATAPEQHADSEAILATLRRLS